ncbi:MAG: hypothetical protein HYV63_16560 [Candidatus Schekmanbacteria bacterium]|nr:hypothetical protein [Candidatus Schekmanbacteria bacterium]
MSVSDSDQAPEATYAEDSPSRLSAIHLQVLLDLMSQDYLARPDWRAAISDTARMLKEAVNADTACVAIYHDDESWRVYSADGLELEASKIGASLSRTVLELARALQQKLHTTREKPLDIKTLSVIRQHIRHVLSLPIFIWEVTEGALRRRFYGVAYLDRRADMPFTSLDARIAESVTAIASRNLNLLYHVQNDRHGAANTRSNGRSERPAISLAEIQEAILTHGDAATAARHLGITRDVLVWKLKKVGLTVHEVQRVGGDPRQNLTGSQLRDAISKHGSAAAAAEHLGVSRHVISRRLKTFRLSVREILADRKP